MRDTTVQALPLNAQEDTYRLETVEEDLQKTIDNLRDRANQMEAALARAPANIRKMTRANAQLLGLHF